VNELEEVVRLAPRLAAARIDLADVLTTIGKLDEARAQLTVASTIGDAGEREAALAALHALGGHRQHNP